MKLRYLPAPEVDVQLMEDTIAFLLNGFVPAPGQRLISTDELVKMANRSLDEVHIELIRISRIQVDLNG
ncbi:hypothetical protein [Deinococcus altitudinis]|uniref:hypothetical protein n=1 Tax=Deinococcus altitudinis TaxID=468914 RepID=UPI00389285C6